MQWWALAEVATFKGEREWVEWGRRYDSLCRHYVSQNTISGLNAYMRWSLTQRTMNNLAQFLCVRICVAVEWRAKRKIIRKSLNNDDEIELSFRFNENWIKFNSLSSPPVSVYGKFERFRKNDCVPWMRNEGNVYATCTDYADQCCV